MRKLQHAMHGSVEAAMRVLDTHPKTNVNELEGTSGRSALHKAAFWGHTDMCAFLVDKCGLNVNVQVSEGQ
jgi:ankyrin repeat protein